MLPSNIHVPIGERYHHPLLHVTAKLICAEHPIISRSFNPCPITVHMEPLPPQSSKFTFEYLLLHQDLQHVQFRIDFRHVFSNKHMHPPTYHMLMSHR